MKKITKLVSMMILTAFLAFTSPAVQAQDGDRDRENTTKVAGDDDDEDDDDGDSGKWGLLGLLGLAGLLGLKRRDDDNHTKRS